MVDRWSRDHCHRQMVLLPYGHTAAPPPNLAQLARVAGVGNAALHAVHGKTYEVRLFVLYKRFQFSSSL